MATDHTLREFTPERLEIVREEWQQIAGEDEFEVELATVFEWTVSHVKAQEGDSQALELYNTSRNQTDAILEVIDRSRQGLTKLLKLWVSPVYWPTEAVLDVELRAQVVQLHAAAFAQVIKAGMINGTKTVKIYGRTNLMLSVLRALHDLWPDENLGWTTRIEGRWLAILQQN